MASKSLEKIELETSLAQLKEEHIPFVKKFTKALGSYICEKVEDGISVRALCKGNTSHGMINEATVYRWKKQYPEFKSELDAAYRTYVFKQMDEINELSLEFMQITKKMKECSKEEAMALRLYAEGIRQRIDVLKFSLAKLAPKLIPELKDQATTQVAVIPNINIISYKTEQ